MTLPSHDPHAAAPIAATLPELLGIAIAVGGGRRALRLDPEERAIASGATAPGGALIAEIARRCAAGEDPLGQAFCRIKSAAERRAAGATFTPEPIIEAMLDWAQGAIDPALIIDPGAGTARYAIRAAQRFPRAQALAIETDPALRILAKARLIALRLSDRVRVVGGSFLDMDAALTNSAASGPTLFIGNPPYSRHHALSAAQKAEHGARCARLGIPGSSLSGLHIHFLAKAFELARPGDAICLITASEWMQTNYGASARALLANPANDTLIGCFPKALSVFEDAMSSAAILCARIGRPSASVRLRALGSPADITEPGGSALPIDEARAARSWSLPEAQAGCALSSAARPFSIPMGGRTLGDLFQVSRGLATGMNSVWVLSPASPKLPESLTLACITRATEIIGAPNARLESAQRLRRIARLPDDLDALPKAERAAAKRFLAWAKAQGADKTFTATHRSPWWRMEAKAPPEIVMTYMGRRPPAFARNIAGASLLNIAHGLRLKAPLPEAQLDALVAWLNQNVSTAAGRTYAGGLVKFEPKEAMRIPIPTGEQLLAGASRTAAPIPTLPRKRSAKK